jgi:TatA/E family protein of Tat protein translocase
MLIGTVIAATARATDTTKGTRFQYFLSSCFFPMIEPVRLFPRNVVNNEAARYSDAHEAILLLLFGAKRVPQLAKSLGVGARELKKAASEDADESETEEASLKD